MSRADARHVIETLRWECRGGDRREALRIQQRLSLWLNGPGTQALSELFDRLSPPGRTWRIDALEIDLGSLPPDAGMELWSRRLEQKLTEELLRRDLRERSGAGAASPATRPTGEAEMVKFVYYLEHGRLPWSAPARSAAEMADWLEGLARHMGPRLWWRLQRLPDGERVLGRLSHIFPCHGLHALLGLRHGALAGALDSLEQAVLLPLRARGRLSAYPLERIRQRWRMAGLRALWGSRGSGLAVTQMRALLAELAEALCSGLGRGWTRERPPVFAAAPPLAAGSELAQSLLVGLWWRVEAMQSDTDAHRSEADTTREEAGPAGTRRATLNATWRESLRQFALAHQGDRRVRAAGLGLSELQAYLLDYTLTHLAAAGAVPQDHVAWHAFWRVALDALARPEDGSGRGPWRSAGSDRNGTGPKGESRSPPTSEEGAEERPGGLSIDNAGLVLLVNYAPRLFAMLGLTRERAFVDEAARARAVHCLAYLVDGDESGAEHQWVLNKVLCGMDIDAPVVPTGALAEARATLDGLITAVIQHWSALGNTSPAGLRQTFLRRGGRLSRRTAEDGGHWRLRVKPGPFDMLLDRLPWGYTTIKLPWMAGAIHVEWR